MEDLQFEFDETLITRAARQLLDRILWETTNFPITQHVSWDKRNGWSDQIEAILKRQHFTMFHREPHYVDIRWNKYLVP